MEHNVPYVLITPAHNEDRTIGRVISSVVSQTVLPVKWVIVSDGSTDRTDEIVREACSEHDWIELVRLPEHRDRQFAAKVYAFNAGYEKLRGLDYEIIGNLDADASFGEDYFEVLLQKFEENPVLGVAGTAFIEDGQQAYDYSFTNIEHVTGIIQLFRRQCFEDIGGYLPVKEGGIDWIAVTTARMMGWQTRSFLDRQYRHHRKMGTAGRNALQARFRYGMKDYFLGGHPLWEIPRSFYQMVKKPYILGGLSLMAGYLWASIRRVERPISKDLMAFHRKEQMDRLKSVLMRFRKSRMQERAI